ncbi:hypothetical protein AGABI2DRAFT_153600 [Agaricus bisporus var. bisporus H97]|uniref:hypothetical protein n=1 Tax=Agaricus bisporus var. bisporus (strain H97 / ATCC MYA-4626 / FGSC 10389) TaxID=936046 RepID=UPI00029F53DE|nr:hypothetical protein AGABI2DRAFT_153600 [Agaricus bisporus var. bisporus H97]EKV43566.1 hypothetical protein AGABI2DRAFT_153600 [Agaricus bisporus var. bisporus H97]
MSHGQETNRQESLTAGFNDDPVIITNRRSAFPHPSTTQGTSGTRNSGSRESVIQTKRNRTQLIGRNLDLHPNLLQWVEGNAYIEGLSELSDGEKDRLIVEYTEAVDRAHRGKEENISGAYRGEEEGELDGRDRWKGREEREAQVNRSTGFDGGEHISRRIDKPREFWPWQIGGGEALEHTPNQRATIETLELFNQDFPLTERRIVSAPGAPKHFPLSEWRNILRGVLANQFVSRPLPEDVACVAGVEVRTPGRERSKRVESCTDWVIAWGAAVEAVAFVFPHHHDKLNQHTAYILQKFWRKSINHHSRIILFNEALREAVGGGENCSLCDADLCESFTESILQPDGVEYFSLQQ